VLVSVFGELVIRELYYRWSTEVSGLLVVFLIWVSLLLAVGVATKWLSAVAAQRVDRFAVCVALAVWPNIVGSVGFRFRSWVDSGACLCNAGAGRLLCLAHGGAALGCSSQGGLRSKLSVCSQPADPGRGSCASGVLAGAGGNGYSVPSGG
jgi:hypothetical protein